MKKCVSILEKVKSVYAWLQARILLARGNTDTRGKLRAKVAIPFWEWKIEFFEREYMNEAAGKGGCQEWMQQPGK